MLRTGPAPVLMERVPWGWDEKAEIMAKEYSTIENNGTREGGRPWLVRRNSDRAVVYSTPDRRDAKVKERSLNGEPTPEAGFRVMIGGDVARVYFCDKYPTISDAREAAHKFAVEASNATPSKTFSVVPFGEKLKAYGAFGRG
jgi:hypothetical protein